MMKKILSFILVLLLCASLAWAEDVRVAPIERTTINGMTIVLQKTASPAVEVALLLKSGSGLDPEGKKGAAAIMNNLVYLKLRYGGEEVGLVDVNTTPDYTMVLFKVSADNLAGTLAAIKELLTYPLYNYDLITDIQGLYRTDLRALPPYIKAYYELNREFYGRNHPYNDEFTPELIAAINGHDVYQWYRQTYQPGNAILSIAGATEQNLADIAKYFADMRTESVDHRLLVEPVTLREVRRIDREDPNGRVTSICIGFAAPRMQDPEFPAFRLIAYYLEEYQQYFEELRVKDGLMYAGFALYNYLSKPKAPAMIFLTITDPASLERVEARTLEVVRQIATQGIPAADLAQIIKAIRTEHLARQAAGRGVAYRNAMSHYLQNQLIYEENLLARLEKIGNEEIKQAAAKYFTNYIRVAYIPGKLEEGF
jgi:predicted Zn-dependent peptidase